MKIIHTADIHLESKLKNLGSTKARIRKPEIREAFFKLIDYASKNDVKVIMIAGDFFDAKTVKVKTLKEITSKIKLHPKIDFLYLSGNHDDNSVFENEEITELPQNLKLFKKENYYQYGKIRIIGVDIFKSSQNKYLKQLTLNEDDFNIVMMHGSPNEIPLKELAGKYINYLALGDIHIPDIKEKQLDHRGVYGYAGILEPRGFDELGERGFFLLEIKNRQMTRTFIKNNKRNYHIIDVDISELNNFTLILDKINKKTKNINKDDIVRVVLKGLYDYETVKDINSILVELKKRFFYAEIKDESRLNYKNVDFEKEISLRGIFLRLVKESDLELEKKDKIIEFGLKALKGEEIEL